MSETINQQARAVRQETISILENLAKKADEFELPKPPEALEHYRQRLEENSYKVLVGGEAKRGKSTFVNALIGRDILPTNVRVTTSQVFSVRPGEREAYRLRFEDDSVHEITLDDLPRYGSQVLEDAGEKPRLDQIIRWIEVDTPTIRFLPDGVSILDTPGLGGLYAAHAQVTQRFVPQANAVIFVLDSEKPIVQTEIEFIETILDVTPYIFFIQTKIDQFGENQWRDIQRRNQEILEEKFENRLTDTRVWPISSTLLLSAAVGGEDADEDLEESRHKELETALRTFLFRIAGWSRSAEAILVADRYRTTSRQTLIGRLAGLVEDREKREELQQRAADHRRQFERDWGSQGQKRRELVDGIKRTAAQGRKSIREALQPNGRITATQREKIDAVQSPKEAKQLNEVVPDEVVATAMAEWRQVTELAQKRCVELFGPFLNEADTMNAAQDPNQPDLAVRSRDIQEIENKLWAGFKGSRTELAPMVPVASAVLLVSTALPAVGVALGGLIWAAVYGYKRSIRRQTKIAKEELRKNLDYVLQQVRQQLTETDMESGRDGLVDEYFAAVERTMLQQVQEIAKQKEKEARAEHARLLEAEKLNEKQRKDSIEQARRQLAEWDEIGKAIENVSGQLNALDQPTAVTSPVAG